MQELYEVSYYGLLGMLLVLGTWTGVLTLASATLGWLAPGYGVVVGVSLLRSNVLPGAFSSIGMLILAYALVQLGAPVVCQVGG